MKRHAFWGVLVVLGLLAPLALLLLSCGGGGGSSTSGTSGDSGGSGTSGTLSVAITDAKPKLPAAATHVFVTFDEVSVHKAGGGWISLPVVAPAPHTIDLLQFNEGKTTQLVPPVRLDSGKYTQIRLGVTSASIVFDDGTEEPLDVPSGSLKTAQDFNFEVHGGGAVDLVVDFDLSRSIVVTGSHKFKLKPVLHIVQTFEAAEIKGSIPAAAFGTSTEPAVVTVWWDKDTNCILDENVDEIYTQIEVPKAEPAADFDIFWLVPNEAYIVQIDVGGNTFFFTVPGTSGGVCQTLPPSAVFHLELATIQGTIPADAFGTPPSPATVTVYVDTQPNCVLDSDGSDKQYTQLTVSAANPTFSIPVFPGDAYILEILVNGNTFVYAVPGSSGGSCQKLAPDAIFNLAPATIEGSIAATTFNGSNPASVTVYLDQDFSGTVSAGDPVYTNFLVAKATPNFSVSVFPLQAYIVRVVGSTTKDFPVSANQLPLGGTFTLNGGTPI
jgi:hypothetical protein